MTADGPQPSARYVDLGACSPELLVEVAAALAQRVLAHDEAATAARVNGLHPPAPLPLGFVELRDRCLRAAHSRTQPQTLIDWRQVVDSLRMPARVLRIHQVAAVLEVSARTVEGLVASGTLPAVRIGTNVRVRVADLDAYVAALPAREPSAAKAAS